MTKRKVLDPIALEFVRNNVTVGVECKVFGGSPRIVKGNYRGGPKNGKPTFVLQTNPS